MNVYERQKLVDLVAYKLWQLVELGERRTRRIYFAAKCEFWYGYQWLTVKPHKARRHFSESAARLTELLEQLQFDRSIHLDRQQIKDCVERILLLYLEAVGFLQLSLF